MNYEKYINLLASKLVCLDRKIEWLEKEIKILKEHQGLIK